jgi:signal transduction histidine kinase
MFRSLRSRLWFSHSLLIVLVLALMAAGLAVYLVRNPLADRQALVRMDLAAGFLARQLERIDSNAIPEGEFLTRLEELDNYRLIIRSRPGVTSFDSEPEAPDLRWDTVGAPPAGRGRLVDSEGQIWLYTARPLSLGRQLFLLVPRAGGLRMLFSPGFREIFRDEIVKPFVRIGLGAGLLAFLTAFGISRSITKPLQRMSEAAEKLAAGEHRQINPTGPREIQSLAHSLNKMLAKVHASRQAQRDFVANVSHELKTPLTSIRGFAGAIQDGTAESAGGSIKAAGIIAEEADRMQRMVQELLDLARLDAGTAGLKREPVNLHQVLSSVVNQLAPQAREAGVALDLQSGDLPTMLGDQDRLRQVFMNLMDNAVQHAPSDTAVEVLVRHQKGELVISIRDQGQGIPEEEHSRIFERFYQVDKSRDRSRGTGTGLGLAIAQELVKAHGGSINLTSQPGRGTTFQVRLPAVRDDDSTVTSLQGGSL